VTGAQNQFGGHGTPVPPPLDDGPDGSSDNA